MIEKQIKCVFFVLKEIGFQNIFFCPCQTQNFVPVKFADRIFFQKKPIAHRANNLLKSKAVTVSAISVEE